MTVRVDRWLWAVRLFPSRSRATEACADGRVHVNGRRAKPALKVGVGDQVDVRDKRGDRVVVITDPIDQRVGASLAVDCYDDHSPTQPVRQSAVLKAGERDRGAGRPTKRDRRRIDDLRHNPERQHPEL